MKKILICFATLTGNTQMVSEVIAERLLALLESSERMSHYTLETRDAVEVEAVELENYDVLLMGSSSWGDGEYNPISEDFADRVRSSDPQPNLSGKKLIVFGLGDSIYERFCGAVDNYEELFKSIGAELMTPSLRLDGYPDEEKLAEVADWVDGWSKLL